MTTTTTTVADGSATACPHCGAKARVSDKTPLCRSCTNALRDEAFAQQERDYLRRYLAGRVDSQGHPLETALTVSAHDQREIARLVKRARQMHLDWTKPPEPMDFTTRLARVAAEFTPLARRNNARGRPKHKDVSSIVPKPQEMALRSA
jgi:ribosomal protein S18